VQLVDSHCHLDDAQFDGDREAAIQRALDAGIVALLAIGTGNGPPDLEAALRLAEKYPFIYATAGIHPNDAGKVTTTGQRGSQAALGSPGSVIAEPPRRALPAFTQDSNTFADLARLTSHPKIKAVGEIGLDYHWGVPKETQLPVFVRQLEIAAAACMPIVIHTRDAFDDTIQVLKQHWVGNGLPCVMHCFTGTVSQARQCLELGFYLAFGGVATFPKATEVRESARIVPLDRLLLETDAPYLAPAPFRGKRNEPSYVAHTAKVIAQVRGVDPEELAEQTTRNFIKLLGVEPQPPASTLR
jgi:TatD DNase family protein